MRRGALIAVGLAVLVALGVWATRAGQDDAPTNPQGGAARRGAGAEERAEADGAAPATAEELTGGVAFGDAPGGGLPVPPDPMGAYEAALAMTIEPPPTRNEAEAGRVILQQVRRISESVEIAVAFQRELARADPTQASKAAGRAAELYDHIADQLQAVPVPPGMTPADAQQFHQGLSATALEKRKQAAMIRARGLQDDL